MGAFLGFFNFFCITDDKDTRDAGREFFFKVLLKWAKDGDKEERYRLQVLFFVASEMLKRIPQYSALTLDPDDVAPEASVPASLGSKTKR